MRAGPRGRGRERMWEAMRSLRRFCIQDIVDATGEKDWAVKDYLTGLRRAGIVAATGTRPSSSGHQNAFDQIVYSLINDMGMEAPRVRKDGSIIPEMGRDRLWRVMRILKEFSIADLVVHASLPEAPVAESEAVYYCQYLTRAGYLVEVESKRLYRFLQAQYTGPRAPVIRRIREVVDANTGEVRWSGDEREERP